MIRYVYIVGIRELSSNHVHHGTCLLKDGRTRHRSWVAYAKKHQQTAVSYVDFNLA